VGNYYRWY